MQSEKKLKKKQKRALLEVDRSKRYPLDEAIELAKKTSYSKFPGSLEVHVKLEKTKKGESVRGIIQLPHGNGKEINAAVIDDEIIEKILKDKNTKYDILIATPQMMPKIAKIAKILGPLGKMPNPKSGTVTTEPEKAIEEIKKGKVEYKADKQGIIHLTLGKINWDDNKLKENFQTLLNQLTGQKLNSVVLCATMGPGIKVNL